MLRIQKLRMRSSGKTKSMPALLGISSTNINPWARVSGVSAISTTKTGAAPVAAKVDPPRVAGRLRAARHEGEDDSGKSRPQCAEKPGGALRPDHT